MSSDASRAMCRPEPCGVDLLEQAFYELKENAAPGVDRLTWRDYEAELECNLEDLHDRVHRGAYRALPSRRVYIPKPDGRQRPLALAALEDKIVQRAVVALLKAIYEEEFLGSRTDSGRDAARTTR
jgi:RNA-directed DNA polymerase